jgi:hypothetical protein
MLCSISTRNAKSSTWVLKFNAHLQCDFISLLFCCTIIYYNTVDSNTAKPFKQSILHIMFSIAHSHTLRNITPLVELAVQLILFFIYVDRVESEIPHACATSLLLLYFSKSLLVFQQLSFPSIYSSVHSCFTLMCGLKIENLLFERFNSIDLAFTCL